MGRLAKASLLNVVEVFFLMISKELSQAISGYESYINNHGISLEVIEAYHTAVFWANEKDNDIETALKIAPRAK